MAMEVLEAGITTVRDVGCDDAEAIALRQAVELGIVPGPQVFSCAKIISATSPGGVIFNAMYRQADGPDEMRKAVREQIRAGADFIKLMATGARSVQREDPEPAQMTRAEIATIVEEAHRMGLRVAATPRASTASGLPSTRAWTPSSTACLCTATPRFCDQMADQGTVLVPTLSTFHDLAERFSGSFPDARRPGEASTRGGLPNPDRR